ncbi:MAG: hypothetical protein JXD21_02680 [Candidatus Omnitrophica bacterium]|nr:hypothetical protein [Candidatus Omnitrophota bacterium]
MRFLICALIVAGITLNGYGFSNTVEFDFNSPHSFHILLSQVQCGQSTLNGDVAVHVTKKEDYLIYNIHIDGLGWGGFAFSPIEAKIIKKGSEFIINYAKSKDFLIRGKIDYAKNIVDLNVNVHMAMTMEGFLGDVQGDIFIQGSTNNPLLRGKLLVKDGKLVNFTFKETVLFFSGTYPYLNVSDSQTVLPDGTAYILEGRINIRDFQTMYASLRSSAKEIISIGDWKIYRGIDDAGIGRDVDSRLGVRLGGSSAPNQAQQLGTELRFRLDENKFLKYRIEEDKSILGFERKSEF